MPRIAQDVIALTALPTPLKQEIRMRMRISLVAVALVAGCVSTPSPNQVHSLTVPEPQEESATESDAERIDLVEFQERSDIAGNSTQLVPKADAVLGWQLPAEEQAQTDEAYDLSTLLGLATTHNPTLRQAQLQIAGNLAKAQQAGLYPNPTLAYLGENIGSGGTAGEFQGAELEQRFVTGGKLRLSQSKYLQRAKVAEHLAVVQQFKVCNDVKLHFLAALEAQQELELQNELLKSAEDRLVTVRELFNLGQANEVDVRKTNAELRRVQLGVLAAENRVRQTFLDLTAIIGIELVYQPLEGNLAANRELIDFDQAYSRLLCESPELLAAHSKLREDHITVHREQVEWVPDIVVSGGSGYNFDAGDSVANAMVRMEIPIFDRNQGTIQQARADQQRQRLEVRRIEMMLRRELSAEYDRYLSALQKVENYEQLILPELRAAYQQSLQSYQQNREEWPTVLDAHTEYTMRRMEHVHNLRELGSAQVLIHGYLLKGGLDPASGPSPPGHIDSVPKPR